MYNIMKSLATITLDSADYITTHEAMLSRTLERISQKKRGVRTADELWIVDHNDVYTLGQASKPEHILQQTATPIIQTDRGGQVTWHGHGQLVIYWLFDLESLGWGVRHLVSHAEQAIEDVVNDCLAHFALADQANDYQSTYKAQARRDAPGVYIYSMPFKGENDLSASQALIDCNNNTALHNDDQNIMLGKVASLGFKIKHGFSYHGIALNIDCDLSAFQAINPCGYAGMQMLRLADFIAMQKNSRHESKIKIKQASRELMSNPSLNYAQVTQKLVDNIAKRHAGLIKLRVAN